MIVLVDTSHSLKECSQELGCEVGQLLTPLTRFSLQNHTLPWAIDNGAYSAFEENSFLSLLAREHHHRENCLWVAVPDVVGSALRTLEVFSRWKDRLSEWPLALVAQDGQDTLPVPWDEIASVFIGGSTDFKVSQGAKQIIKAAQMLGKQVHAGRVNDPARFAYFEDLGVDTIDGTGISRFSHMRLAISKRNAQQAFDV